MSITPREGAGRPKQPWEGKLNAPAEVAAVDRDGDLKLSADEFVRAQVHGLPHAPANIGEASRWMALHDRYAGSDHQLDADELAALVAAHGAEEGKAPFESHLADLAAKHPNLKALMRDVRVGDVVFFTGEGTIKEMTRGPVVHVGIVSGVGPPPRMIEAVGGLSGVSSNLGKVRASTFYEFVGDSDLSLGRLPTFTVMRPTQDPDLIRRVLAFARRQLGKPYDFEFSGQNDKFYCSELVFDAFSRNPLFPPGTPPLLKLKRDLARDAEVTKYKGLIRKAGVDEKHVGDLIKEAMRGQSVGEKLVVADKLGGLALTGLANYGSNVVAENVEGLKPHYGKVDMGFVSPTLLLEGSQALPHRVYTPERIVDHGLGD